MLWVQVALVLSNLEAFFQEVEPKVDAISGEESDTLAFMKLMSIFNQVRLYTCMQWYHPYSHAVLNVHVKYGNSSFTVEPVCIGQNWGLPKVAL